METASFNFVILTLPFYYKLTKLLFQSLCFNLMILTWKKHPKIKLKRLRKIQI